MSKCYSSYSQNLAVKLSYEKDLLSFNHLVLSVKMSMASSASFKLNSQVSQSEIFWHHLKHAIAASSGFKRWQLERGIHDEPSDLTLDHLVQSYLRETLETLAY